MSVAQEEVLFLSSATGSSAGGANTGIPYSNAKGAFFPNIADVDRLAGGTVTRKWFLWNDSLTDALISPSIWMQSEPRYMVEQLGIGVDSSDDADAAQGNMTAFSAPGVVAVKSSSSDSRSATVYGVNDTGNPATETVVLNGTTEVLTTTVFEIVYSVSLSAIVAGVTVTAYEGSGGTARGVIGSNKKVCWLWLEPLSKGGGMRLPDLPAQAAYAFWDRITWAASIAGVRPNISVIAVEEN